MALDFTYLDGHAVHRQRAREIWPDTRGPPASGRQPRLPLGLGLVAAQWLAAYLVHDLSWLWIVLRPICSAPSSITRSTS